MSGVGKVYTAALCVGGRWPNPTYYGNTELWNGSAWTETTDLNQARASCAGQTGTSASAIAAGGGNPGLSPAYVTLNEDWNGTSWVETADLSTGRSGAGGAGSDSTSAIIFGGFTPSTVATSEIWSSSSNTIKVLTD